MIAAEVGSAHVIADDDEAVADAELAAKSAREAAQPWQAPGPSGGATLRERLHGPVGSPRGRDDRPSARHRELAIRERESAGAPPHP
ncbi:hypothetical protein ABZ464_33970 [Streptomyces sp. NPDC005820]|uniref:hypothetical protein n=1 Tax=Streptomyces sp. NPDC005820 TaxID=3157069 RepID=UPI0033F8484A